MWTTEETLEELREIRTHLLDTLAGIDLEIAWLSPAVEPDRGWLSEQQVRRIIASLNAEDG